MLTAILAAMKGGAARCTFDGVLSTTATGSTTVTSATRTITVPAGNSGQINFDSLDEALGTMNYSKNGGAFTGMPANLTMANTDTLALRGTGLAINESVSVTVVDNTTGSTIEVVVIARGGS